MGVVALRPPPFVWGKVSCRRSGSRCRAARHPPTAGQPTTIQLGMAPAGDQATTVQWQAVAESDWADGVTVLRHAHAGAVSRRRCGMRADPARQPAAERHRSGGGVLLGPRESQHVQRGDATAGRGRRRGSALRTQARSPPAHPFWRFPVPSLVVVARPVEGRNGDARPTQMAGRGRMPRPPLTQGSRFTDFTGTTCTSRGCSPNCNAMLRNRSRALNFRCTSAHHHGLPGGGTHSLWFPRNQWHS